MYDYYTMFSTRESRTLPEAKCIDLQTLFISEFFNTIFGTRKNMLRLLFICYFVEKLVKLVTKEILYLFIYYIYNNKNEIRI